MSQWFEVAGLVAGSGGFGALVTKLLSRRVDQTTANKNEAEEESLKADATESLANAAVLLVAPLQDQITKLTGRVSTLEAENAATKSKLQLAIDHIRELRFWISRQTPDKTPPQPPSALGI